MSARIGTIAGTWGRKEADSGSYYWWKPPSVFIANLKNAGLELVSESDYFDWSTSLDGLGKMNDDWATAGKALYWWWVAHGREPLSLIAHSHGAQVVAYALQYGGAFINAPGAMRLDHLVTVGSPVRADMQMYWTNARPAIKDWTHIYCDEVIKAPDDLGYQALGSQNSGSFPFTRLMAQADRNVELIPPTTHHGLVWPNLWLQHDFYQYLKDKGGP